MNEMEEEVEEDNTATTVGFYNKDHHHFLPNVEFIHFNSNTNFAANLIFANYFGLSCFVG